MLCTCDTCLFKVTRFSWRYFHCHQSYLRNLYNGEYSNEIISIFLLTKVVYFAVKHLRCTYSFHTCENILQMHLELYSGQNHIFRQEIAHANAAETQQWPQRFFFRQKNCPRKCSQNSTLASHLFTLRCRPC